MDVVPWVRPTHWLMRFPGTGSTWVQILIANLICRMSYEDTAPCLSLDLISLAKLLHIQVMFPYIGVSHGGFTSATPYTEKMNVGGHPREFYHNGVHILIPSEMRLLMIILVRGMKDLLASRYHFVTHRAQEWNGSISEFIRHDGYGVKKAITFWNIWYEKTFNKLIVRYEDLQTNPHKELQQIYEFWFGPAPYDMSSVISQAVEFAKFENMRKMEDLGLLGFAKDDIDLSNNNRRKIRKGKVGSHKTELSKKDIEYIDHVLQEVGCPYQGAPYKEDWRDIIQNA